jgi:hypothetical protein
MQPTWQFMHQHKSNMCPTLQLVSMTMLQQATVVATGPDLLVTGAFTLQLHCHFQWHVGSHVQTHNMLVLQKETCKIQSNLDLISSFNGT